MASMNNWLGFSLSPQELPSHHHHHPDHSQISGTDVSSGECFDLSSDSTLPSLNLPSSFGILEAFNRNSQSQDWNMLMGGGTCNNGQNIENQGEGGPKLENFLGGNSFSNHETAHYMYQNLQSDAAEATNDGGGGGGANMNNPNSNIGLSMIKNWLRNQPTPTIQETKQDGGGGGTQSLSLSMSTESPGGGGGGGGESTSTDQNKQLSVVAVDAQSGAIEAVPRKSIDTFGQRTSIYRGVTRHRWTGRYEAHLWDNSCRREGQTRKGRQVYLGGYDKEDKAARAYDLAALKYWGTTTTTNFPISTYEKEIEEMKNMTRQEYVASLRRKSSGFSRGASIYRGVTRHHQHGRWQARIGRVAGNKDLYLGTFSTQEEAAEAYDIAAIKFRGLNAVTNFDMNRYDVKSILESSTLPIGGAAKRLKEAEAAEMALAAQRTLDQESMASHITDAMSNYGTQPNWPTIAFHQAQPLSAVHYPYAAQQRYWCKQEQDVDNSQATNNFQDLNQLQLGNTHNFFQSNSVMQQHNLMSLDSASLEHSSGSNSAVYSSNGEGYNGYVMPLSTVIDNNSGGTNQGNGYADNEMMFGGNNLYYQQQSGGGGGGGSACNNWVPTAVPTLGARAGNVGLCQGFSVWNDS